MLVQVWGYTIAPACLPMQAELEKWTLWRIQCVAFVMGCSRLHSAVSPAAGNIVSLLAHDFFWPREEESLCGVMRWHMWPCHQQEGAPSHQPHPRRTFCSSPLSFHSPHMLMHIQTMRQNNQKANHHRIASPHS